MPRSRRSSSNACIGLRVEISTFSSCPITGCGTYSVNSAIWPASAFTFARPELTVFLVHGEDKAQNILAELLRSRFKVAVNVPAYLEEVTLAPGKKPVVQIDSRLAPKKVNWTFLLAETEGKLAQLRASLADAHNRPWEDQVEIQEQILDLNKRFMHVISNL